jgi:hypothetical protein
MVYVPVVAGTAAEIVAWPSELTEEVPSTVPPRLKLTLPVAVVGNCAVQVIVSDVATESGEHDRDMLGVVGPLLFATATPTKVQKPA